MTARQAQVSRSRSRLRKAEFGINMAGHLSQFHQTLTTQPIGLLHGRQRERLVRR